MGEKINRSLSVLLLLAGIMIIEFHSCAPYVNYLPDPANDVTMWVRNFTQQRSFAYTYEMKTQAVHVRAKGNCVVGWAENIKGIWDYPEPQPDYNFEHIGVNDIEWTMKGSRWEESARGEESNIYIQIERMLNFDKFEYLNPDNGYNYRFKANVPFLAPNRWNEMIGFLKISKSTFLPEVIWAGLPDSSIYWQVKLSRYNQKKMVNPPVKAWSSFTIAFDSTENRNALSRKIQRRLKSAGVAGKVFVKDSLLIIKVPSVYNASDIVESLLPGDLKIYGIAQNRESAYRIGYVKGATVPIFLTAPLVTSPGETKAVLGFDNWRRPYIMFSLKRSTVELPDKVAVEIDSTIIGIASLDRTKKINKIRIYPDMDYYRLNQIKSYINQVLPFLKVNLVTEGSN